MALTPQQPISHRPMTGQTAQRVPLEQLDVQLLSIQQGSHELGASEDLLIAGSVLVDLRHHPDPLEINLLRSAPELFFQPIDPCVIDRDSSRGTLLCILCLFHFVFSFLLVICLLYIDLHLCNGLTVLVLTPPSF